jgi:hypothetical protein
VSIVVNGEVQAQLTEVKSSEFMVNFKTLEAGYLGEKANRYDEIYDGYSGKIDLDNSSPAIFDFIESVKARAQRQEPGTVINIKTTLNFPTGEKKRIVMQDAFFDAMGIGFGSRDAYGTTSLNFKGTEFRVI